MSLASLGLSVVEEHLYRSLLREPDADIAADLEPVIARLAALELVHRDDAGRVTAVDPEVAVARLIRGKEREANAELRRITAAWNDLPSLIAERSEGSRVESVERIDDRKVVDQRLWALASDAHEVLTIHTNRLHNRAEPAAQFLQRLAEGVEWRTILHRKCLRTANLIAYATALHRAGDRHRVTDDTLQRMVIIDRSVAFVPTTANVDGAAGAYIIRQPGVVTTLVDLFEQTWARAVDLEPVGRPALSPVQRHVLYLLSRVDKDEIAAREMSVSLRTYRRYVAELLVRLGAANRFQAAVLAKEHGWI